MNEMEIPKLIAPKCSVIQTELSTGHILTITGEIYLSNSNEKYALIFDSFENAKAFCANKLKEKTNIEFCIYDHLGKFVEIIRH